MKKFLKIIIIFFLALIILGTAVVIFGNYYFTPERLASLIETIASKALGKPLDFDTVSFDLFDDPHVTLYGIEYGTRDEVYLKAEKITARFSKWRLLFGVEGIKTVDLVNPYIEVHIDNLKKDEKPPEIPLIRTSNATCILYYKEDFIKFDNVRGSASSYRANIYAEALGGSFNVIALKAGPSWKGTATLSNISLKGIDKRFSGLAASTRIIFITNSEDISADIAAEVKDIVLPDGTGLGHVKLKTRIEKKGQTYSGSPELDISNALLSWGGSIEHLYMKSSFNADKINLFIKDLDVKSNLINFKGSVSARGLNKKSDMNLDIKIKSDEFAYEPFVAFLPVKEFPEWLITLLTKQIRKGSATIEHASYSGKVKDFNEYESCIRNLDIALRIHGQTFSARPGNIIRNIKARLVTKNGDLDVLNITGTAGRSTVKSVTLNFPGTDKPGFRIGVLADIDMEASDFIQVWRAGVTEMNVNTFLDPVKKIRTGHILGQAHVFYEEETGGARIKGNASLSGVELNWDDSAIKNLSGKIVAHDFFKPLNVEAKCTYDNRPVDMLLIDITDPFDKIEFTYNLKTRGVPGSEIFSLDKDAAITAQGSGQWPDLKGNLLITSRDFTVYGTRVKPKTGFISGKGPFSAKIGKRGFIDIPSLETTLGNAILKTKIYTDDDRTSIKLSGKLDVSMFDIIDKGEFSPVSGTAQGDFSVDIAKDASFLGSFDLSSLTIEYKNKLSTASGHVSMDNKNFHLKDMAISQSGAKALINGDLIIKEVPEFKGTIAIADLKIENGTGDSLAKTYLKKIDADANIELTNLTVQGINIQNGTVHAQLDGGTVKLLSLDLKIPYGSIAGSAVIPGQGNVIYDLNLSLKNAPIHDFLKLISKDDLWLSGTMDISGHVWNPGDAMNGFIKFKAVKGVINKYKLVSNIFSFLNPYKIIKTGDIDLLHKGFPYNHIASDFTIRDSIMYYEGFYLDSNSLQISAVGKYVLRTNYIDTVMGIQPLESFDKTLGMIPIVGWVLTGDKGTLIVVSVRVRGPVEDTSVRYLPANSISTPVQETILRVLKLPVDILTKPKDVILPGMNKDDKKKSNP